MRVDVSVELPFPRAEVFSVYRDKLTELVPYLPNVRGIVVVSRTDEGPVTRLLNRWKGGGEIPRVARQLVSEELLQWDDYATWDSATWTTKWRTVVPAFKDAIEATGENRFEEVGPTLTRYTIRGDLVVDASKVKGVPRLLQGAIKPIAETILVGAIKPNLLAVSRGVEQYLVAARARPGPAARP